MLWGAMKTTQFLEQYRKFGFHEHPKIMVVLALAAVQHEGSAVADAAAEYSREANKLKSYNNRITACETWQTTLKKNNPTLK